MSGARRERDDWIGRGLDARLVRRPRQVPQRPHPHRWLRAEHAADAPRPPAILGVGLDSEWNGGAGHVTAESTDLSQSGSAKSVAATGFTLPAIRS